MDKIYGRKYNYKDVGDYKVDITYYKPVSFLDTNINK